MVEASKLRAWYQHRHGLDGSLEGKPAADVLARAGWARSVGGVSPYLTLFARAGITREQADTAAQELQIYELPSARGCTYVLPASDFALGLAAGQGFDSDMKAAVKLGVTEKEIAKLCDAVVAAVAAESAARVQTIARRSSLRAGAALFRLDPSRIPRGFSSVRRNRREGNQSGARSFAIGAHRHRPG